MRSLGFISSFALISALSFFACSSSDSTGTTNGSSSGNSSVCGINTNSNAKVTAVSSDGSNAATCPKFTPDQFNTDDGSDAGDDCKPIVDQSACTMKIDCSSTDPDGTKTTEKGTFVASGKELKGTFTVDVKTSETELACTYAMTFTVP